MKGFYKIPSWLLGLCTAITFFGSVEKLTVGHYTYGTIGVLAFLGLFYYTFIKVKE